MEKKRVAVVSMRVWRNDIGEMRGLLEGEGFYVIGKDKSKGDILVIVEEGISKEDIYSVSDEISDVVFITGEQENKIKELLVIGEAQEGVVS